ncbi:MAG: nicotinate-nucleotide adenylyltransferase [Coleofasciculaceae cyanobacterium RL_1_1]|nr:nicotinate-nucleotide adenylyltransferase [Coleofasciculaceae cyanobacterium RL_1_1]
MNIALFGTSADPPSVGHRAVIRWLADRFDRVLIWASDNPFKPDRTPLEQRTEMLALMVETLQSGQDGSPCHNVECRADLSHMRSIISVQRAKALWPQAEFTFAIGSDLIAQLPSWYRSADLLRECSVIAIPRPGYPIDHVALATLRSWGTVTTRRCGRPPDFIQCLPSNAEFRSDPSTDCSLHRAAKSLYFACLIACPIACLIVGRVGDIELIAIST